MRLLHVVHVGAGNHLTSHDAHFKKLIRSAVRSATLAEASEVIERCVSTNTAKGSSLDLQGNAYSDSNILEVDAWNVKSQCTILNIQNQRLPTRFTQALSSWLDGQYKAGTVNGVLGLSRPIVLEYGSIKNYFQSSHDLKDSVMIPWFLSNDSLVLRRAARDFETFKGYMSTFMEEGKQCSESKHVVDQAFVQDTVGLLYLDSNPGGVISLATSSGGNFYKLPGRISCAGVPGSGIAYGEYEGIEVCCMCSGNGDDIIQMNLASYICDSIAEMLAKSTAWPDLGTYLVERVTRRGKRHVCPGNSARNQPLLYLGVILVVRSANGVRLVYCHSTETFFFGFESNGNTEVVLSRNEGKAGKFLHGEFKLF